MGPSHVMGGNAQNSQKSLSNLKTSWRDNRHKKKTSLSHSVLNSRQNNNFLHWHVKSLRSSFQMCNVKHQEGKRCAFIQISLVTRTSWKTNVPWNTSGENTVLDTLNSKWSIHSSGLNSEFNRGCGIASSWQKASQLTFPAPTGPTTANSSPGLTVKERPCRVGVSDAYKYKLRKLCSTQ